MVSNGAIKGCVEERLLRAYLGHAFTIEVPFALAALAALALCGA